MGPCKRNETILSREIEIYLCAIILSVEIRESKGCDLKLFLLFFFFLIFEYKKV